MYTHMGRVDIRVPDAELERWRELSHEEGKSLSEWIRERCRVQGMREGAEVRADGGREFDAGEGMERKTKGPKKVKVCVHGTEKGYRCWQCGGPSKCE